MEKISTCLWFDNQAEEAARFYTSIFKNSKIGSSADYNEEGSEVSGQPEGSVMTVEFEIEGRKFTALNGGPIFKFTEAISLMVHCKDQEEVDYYWEKLMEGGGEESQCGWLKDKFGLSWQVVPNVLGKLIGSSDKEKSERAMHAMLKMKKLDIQKLQDAYDGK